MSKAETGIRNELNALIPHSEFHIPHSRDGDHEEQKLRFFRIVTIALVTAASVSLAVPGSAAFAGTYASYRLAATLSGTVGVEEGVQAVIELAGEFDRYLAPQRSDRG